MSYCNIPVKQMNVRLEASITLHLWFCNWIMVSSFELKISFGLKIRKKDKDGIETLESGKKSHRRPCGIQDLERCIAQEKKELICNCGVLGIPIQGKQLQNSLIRTGHLEVQKLLYKCTYSQQRNGLDILKVCVNPAFL